MLAFGRYYMLLKIQHKFLAFHQTYMEYTYRISVRTKINFFDYITNQKKIFSILIHQIEM